MHAEVIGSFVISLREALEAALIVSIIVAVLKKTGRLDLVKHAALGVAASIMLGLGTGAVVWLAYGGFPEKELFEAASSFLAVAVLTWVIYWMARAGPSISWEISRKTTLIATGAGMALFTFIIVYREALETVLLMTPYMLKNPTASATGFTAGLIVAVAISFMIYVAGYRVNLRKFFMMTSILLIFIASGILGYGIHEVLEYMEEEGIELGALGKEAYDLGISEDSILHHKGVLGSVLAVMFGYSVSMEWARLIVQGTYLIVALALVLKAYGVRLTYRRKK